MLHGHQHVRYREGGAAMKTKQKTFVFASLFADDIQGMVEYKAALGHKCESYPPAVLYLLLQLSLCSPTGRNPLRRRPGSQD